MSGSQCCVVENNVVYLACLTNALVIVFIGPPATNSIPCSLYGIASIKWYAARNLDVRLLDVRIVVSSILTIDY